MKRMDPKHTKFKDTREKLAELSCHSQDTLRDRNTSGGINE